MARIDYTDKVAVQFPPLPNENLGKADDFNEIKASVNTAYNAIESLRTIWVNLTTGDDNTAVVGHQYQPFATLQAAADRAINDGLNVEIVVMHNPLTLGDLDLSELTTNLVITAPAGQLGNVTIGPSGSGSPIVFFNGVVLIETLSVSSAQVVFMNNLATGNVTLSGQGNVIGPFINIVGQLDVEDFNVEAQFLACTGISGSGETQFVLGGLSCGGAVTLTGFPSLFRVLGSSRFDSFSMTSDDTACQLDLIGQAFGSVEVAGPIVMRSGPIRGELTCLPNEGGNVGEFTVCGPISDSLTVTGPWPGTIHGCVGKTVGGEGECNVKIIGDIGEGLFCYDGASVNTTGSVRQAILAQSGSTIKILGSASDDSGISAQGGSTVIVRGGGNFLLLQVIDNSNAVINGASITSIEISASGSEITLNNCAILGSVASTGAGDSVLNLNNCALGPAGSIAGTVNTVKSTPLE